MEILSQGSGKLVGWHDPDDARAWVINNKSRELQNKVLTAGEAVSRYVHDGDFVASGGFGHVRVSMPIVYEIIRQGITNLIFAGNTVSQDLDLLIAAGSVNQVEAAYSFAQELRGLQPASRRMVENGKCTVIAETSNAAYQWRFLAGAMGIPFIPSRNLLGTDTLNYSSCKVIEDPYSGKPVTLIPAAYPDVAFIHVHRCDKYGNAQIDGSVIEDIELSRCARRLILTTEEIVDENVIRDEPWKTKIPFFVVDAVIEVPFGSHPCQMPGMYYYDEEHLAEWMELSQSDDGVKQYLDKYIFGVDSFEKYLKLCGGNKKMQYLHRREFYKEPIIAPWRKSKD